MPSHERVNPADRVRRNIKTLVPYSSARSLHTRGLLLDANESPYNLFGDEDDLNRYPDSSNAALREKAAALFGVSTGECAVGCGSDELIDLLFRIFCEPGKDEIILCHPTYGNYKVLADINDAAVRDVPLTRGFQLDVAGILQAISDKTKLIFLCSPNNPTGNTFQREDITRIAEESRGIVVLDEAYGEFMRTPSLIPEIRRFHNLVVLRTLSKAYAMAGARIGFALADPAVIAFIQKVKLPYNISASTVRLALNALDQKERVREHVAAILEEREKLSAALQTVPGILDVFPSEANFILFRIKNAEAVFRALVEKGIVIRSRTRTPRLENCLRVTVGTPEQNDLFIQKLKEIALQLSI